MEADEVPISAAAAKVVPAAPADPATKPDALSADISEPDGPGKQIIHILIQKML